MFIFAQGEVAGLLRVRLGWDVESLGLHIRERRFRGLLKGAQHFAPVPQQPASTHHSPSEKPTAGKVALVGFRLHGSSPTATRRLVFQSAMGNPQL